MVRAAHKWACKPGSFDALHFSNLMQCDNAYGIPLIKKNEGDIPQLFTSFHQIKKYNTEGIHCFVDDYYLERVWKRPEHYSRYLFMSKLFLSPDYSLYTDMPLAMQIWNTYRSRYVGAYMQELGIPVVPSITWADKDSFNFCFLGVEYGSTVAISTTGANDREKYMQGFNAMIGKVHPERIVCFGRRWEMEMKEATQIDIIHVENGLIERLRKIKKADGV